VPGEKYLIGLELNKLTPEFPESPGVDLEIVWNTVQGKLPQLMAAVQAMENGVR